MKHTIYECDICGEQSNYIKDGWYLVSAKRCYSGYDSSRFVTKKIYICDKCIKHIKSIVSDRSEEPVSIDIFNSNNSPSAISKEIVEHSNKKPIKKKPIGCRDCPHAPKKYEEFCNWDWRVRHGDSHDYDWLIDHNYCIDAFSEQAKYCNNYNKEYPDE